MAADDGTPRQLKHLPARGLGAAKLPPGAVVVKADAPMIHTGGWRSGLLPMLDRERCINCLLCWMYCPDASVNLTAGTVMDGFNLDYCKGCGLCASVCPAEAITMTVESA